MLPYALVIVIMTTILLVLRLSSRIQRSGGKLGFDDALIILSWAMCTTMTAIITYGMIYLKRTDYKTLLNYQTGAMELGWDVHMMKSDPSVWPMSAKVSYSLACLSVTVN